ncbi:myosin IC heavy chain [Triticum aestivum]|uniref:myosin IC heavy chain n=1 Tax=Triticum aestivum TaxID=4565 RepID=UPI001D018591|nr:myosin IC heavy chain-like [Triticum aestivum]
MGDRRKATDDDIPGTGQSHQRARTETTTVDDTSQAPAGQTATAAGRLQPLPGRAGDPLLFRRGGRGGGSGHGGFSQSAPMTMIEQPLRNQGSSCAAPTAGAGDTVVRVSSATVTAVGPSDAWHGALAPPLGLDNPAYSGEPSTRHAPAACATRPPSLPALGHGRGGNHVTVTSLRDASRRRLLARRQPGNAIAPQAQGIPIPSNAGAPQGQGIPIPSNAGAPQGQGIAGAPQGQGIAIGQLDPHRGQSSSVPPEQSSSSGASIAGRCFQCNTQIQRALVVDDSGSGEPYFCKICWEPSSPVHSNAGAPQGQEAVPYMELEAVLDIEQEFLDGLDQAIQRPDINLCLLCDKPLETQTVLVVEGEDPKWICDACEADVQ